MVMFDVISVCNYLCDLNVEVSYVFDEGEVLLYSFRSIERGEGIIIAYGKFFFCWFLVCC